MYLAKRCRPALNYKIFFLLLSFVQISFAQGGCTDPLAINYNPKAKSNDGSCMYRDTILPVAKSTVLPDKLLESSGLISWNYKLITHNDSNDQNLYVISPETGAIEQQIYLEGTKNNDWEAIAQDEAYIYIGDFGNNASGNRKDLNILRIAKKSITTNNPHIDYINFTYEDQKDYSTQDPNKTDYDCEAFFVTKDSIYLMTKQWVSQKTGIYKLPKTPGSHEAQLKSTLEVNGLITDATFVEAKNLILLSGYNTSLMPFIYMIYDYGAYDFARANKRKINLELPITQVEAITTTDGLQYYLTNEHFSRPPFVNSQQRLHKLDLHSFLGEYLKEATLNSKSKSDMGYNAFKIYPLPARDYLNISVPEGKGETRYELLSLRGKRLQEGILNPYDNKISIERYTSGTYFLKLNGNKSSTYKVLKR